MTAEFVAQFKVANPCPQCRVAEKRDTNRFSLCVAHLMLARLKWRQHRDECRRLGRCISCHRRPFPGEQRCRLHKRLNQEKCRAWMAEHPEHSREQYERRQLWLLLDQCPQCKPHRPLKAGRKRCGPCLVRQRGYGK